MDINDSIFKLPFKHGWKRELVYSVPTNHSRRKCNVYYYSPSCQKLQSLKEIKEQLNVSPTNNNRLTIKSFTFLKRPVGINDESKELIRNVNEESFFGIAVTSKKPKTVTKKNVFNNKSSKKSSNKLKVVFKYEKKPKKDKSHLKATSSSAPQYVTEDWQAIPSSIVSIESPLKIVDVSNTTSNKKPQRQKEKTCMFKTNLEMFVHHDSSILNMCTTTVSTTVSTPLKKSTVSVTSAHSNCHSLAVNVPLRHGRSLKNFNHIAKKKLLKKNICKHFEEINTTDSNEITKTDLVSSDAECLQQQLISKSTDFIHNLSNKVNKLLPVDIASVNECVGIDNIDLSLQVNKNKEYIVSSKKKNNFRKKKQSTDIEKTIAEKCILILDNSKDLLMSTNNEPIQSKSTTKQNVEDDVVEYGFECDRYIIKPYRQHTFFGDTYFPINWEYSAAALISHVKKKPSKVTLHKKQLFSNVKNPLLLKTTPTLKRIQLSDTPICDNSSKLRLLSSLVPVKTSSGVSHLLALTTKCIDRPSDKSERLQAVRSNSSRKSPHEHTSALLAIRSNKALKTEIGTQQPDKLQDKKPKNSLDLNGPCKLTTMPNYDRKPEDHLYRLHMQSDHQHSAIKSRGLCRSNIPSRLKLCVEQSFSQRNPINGVTVDCKTVKLQTKHLDSLKRHACDVRREKNYIFQQLRIVHKIAEQNLCDLSSAILQIGVEEQESCRAIILPSDQNLIWSSLTKDDNEKPDNMFIQIMYEQIGDKRFLYTDLTDETLKIYYEQRNLVLAESVINICGDYVSSSMETETILASNKRKKKHPNTAGWSNRKRRNIMARTVDINNDSDLNVIVKCQQASEQQSQRHQRIKLKQQKLKKKKSKVSISPKSTPKQLNHCTNKNKKTTTYCRSTNLKNIKKVEEKSIKSKNSSNNLFTEKNKTEKVILPVSGKKFCSRPKKSVGLRQQLKSKLSQKHQKKTP